MIALSYDYSIPLTQVAEPVQYRLSTFYLLLLYAHLNNRHNSRICLKSDHKIRFRINRNSFQVIFIFLAKMKNEYKTNNRQFLLPILEFNLDRSLAYLPFQQILTQRFGSTAFCESTFIILTAVFSPEKVLFHFVANPLVPAFKDMQELLLENFCLLSLKVLPFELSRTVPNMDEFYLLILGISQASPLFSFSFIFQSAFFKAFSINCHQSQKTSLIVHTTFFFHIDNQQICLSQVELFSPRLAFTYSCSQHTDQLFIIYQPQHFQNSFFDQTLKWNISCIIYLLFNFVLVLIYQLVISPNHSFCLFLVQMFRQRCFSHSYTLIAD